VKVFEKNFWGNFSPRKHDPLFAGNQNSKKIWDIKSLGILESGDKIRFTGIPKVVIKINAQKRACKRIKVLF